MCAIHFFKEDIQFRLPPGDSIRSWLIEVIHTEKKELKELNFIFCSDDYLKSVNKTYLKHDYYTDIVTFDNSEREGSVEGDIFISIDRVRDNAIRFHQSFRLELRRVMVHGVLHLIGYRDKTINEKSIMRQKEDFYLGTL